MESVFIVGPVFTLFNSVHNFPPLFPIKNSNVILIYT